MLLKKRFMFFVVLALLVFAGQAAAGPNANAVVSLDLIADGGAGNQRDDGVTSGTVSGQGTKIVVEVFAKDVVTSLLAIAVEFDFDSSVLVLDADVGDRGVFGFLTTGSSYEPKTATFGSISAVSLPTSGYVGRVEFSTVIDVTGKEFSLGIERVQMGLNQQDQDVVTSESRIWFNRDKQITAADADFDGSGTVDIADFLLFVDVFGASSGDGKYDVRYDLDGNSMIGIPDFLTFVDNFGKTVPSSGGDGGEQIVDIPDANLRAVIADSLGKASGATITQADMLTLTTLLAPNANISDLTGLEYATNLTALSLGRNNISDISTLSSLTSLVVLYLSNNSISDISALSKSTSLTSLSLYRNSISDVSALSNLTSLTSLNLGRNSISDFSPIANLTSLVELSLGGSKISDLSVLPLSNLTSLKSLDLHGNRISDVSAWSSLSNLTSLNLGGNSISDFSPIANLTSLVELSLSANNISDLSVLPLSNLTNLANLFLDFNSISDLSPLSSLTNLVDLSLSVNSISDLSPLSGLTNLRFLNLIANSISDLAPLVANMGLGRGDLVHVPNNPLSDTSLNTHIPALQARGVTVTFGALKPAINEEVRRMPHEVMKQFGLEAWEKEGDAFGQ